MFSHVKVQKSFLQNISYGKQLKENILVDYLMPQKFLDKIFMTKILEQKFLAAYNRLFNHTNFLSGIFSYNTLKHGIFSHILLGVFFYAQYENSVLTKKGWPIDKYPLSVPTLSLPQFPSEA